MDGCMHDRLYLHSFCLLTWLHKLTQSKKLVEIKHNFCVCVLYTILYASLYLNIQELYQVNGEKCWNHFADRKTYLTQISQNSLQSAGGQTDITENYFVKALNTS